MLRDRVASVDLFALVPALQLRFEPELAQLDRLLEDDQIGCGTRIVQPDGSTGSHHAMLQ